jgi:hypothetical protein
MAVLGLRTAAPTTKRPIALLFALAASGVKD